jgi:transcriptional antiterminator NusG
MTEELKKEHHDIEAVDDTQEPEAVDEEQNDADTPDENYQDIDESPTVAPSELPIEMEDFKEPGVPEKKREKKKRWYIVHTYSGHENKVKVNLEKRTEFMNMGHKIFRVEVPEKTVSKVKDGKRIDKEERLFPGYVLVEMIMDDDSWYVVRHTPGVTKFVGAARKPIPAKDTEIKKILRRTQTKVTKVEIDVHIGDKVRIISGPFADFVGDVTEVYPDKEKLRANVSIFGRDTPVELEYNQIQKV